jgi:hypothetical protein
MPSLLFLAEAMSGARVRASLALERSAGDADDEDEVGDEAANYGLTVGNAGKECTYRKIALSSSSE